MRHIFHRNSTNQLIHHLEEDGEMYFTDILVTFFSFHSGWPHSGWPHRSVLLRTPTTQRLFRLWRRWSNVPSGICGSLWVSHHVNSGPRASPRLHDLSRARKHRASPPADLTLTGIRAVRMAIICKESSAPPAVFWSLLENYGWTNTSCRSIWPLTWVKMNWSIGDAY